MADELDAVIERVRDRVTPDPSERERLAAVVDELTARTEAAVEALPVDADVIQVGSTARDTWLAGDRDVDLFVSFPPSLDRDELEEYGLRVGHEVLPEGHEAFAEHPYVVGEFEGFDVDLVPCYAVDDATEIQTAVDRTPFHTRYLEQRIDDDFADEIRICKQFFSGIGVYGSDLRTRGFSGFLTELLVLEYGGFRLLAEAAADWSPPVTFDPEEHGRDSFDDPLILIDPTDPERNVAAVCSPANVARLQHYARELLAEPDDSLFRSTEPDPLTGADVRTAIGARGTTPIALRTALPNLVDDQLWPQLEKSRKSVADELDRRGFDVLRSLALATERELTGDERVVALLFELEVAERPNVERHEGPPVHVREHARSFIGTYTDTEQQGSSYGPFIDGDRYVVERERDFESAVDFLMSDALRDVGLGPDVQTALESGYDVLSGDAVERLADAFGVELAMYFDPAP